MHTLKNYNIHNKKYIINPIYHIEYPDITNTDETLDRYSIINGKLVRKNFNTKEYETSNYISYFCYLSLKIASKSLTYKQNIFKKNYLTIAEIQSLLEYAFNLAVNAKSNTLGVGEIAGGKGTGIDDTSFHKKTALINKHIQKVKNLKLSNTLEIIQHIATPEIIAMTGFIQGAVFANKKIYIDGYISTSALLLANLLDNTIIDKVHFSTLSAEKGHKLFFDTYNKYPILNIGLKYGAGLATLLAWQLEKNLFKKGVLNSF